MEPTAISVIDLDFSFRNTTKETFQLASKSVTAQVIKFQDNGRELHDIPDVGTAIGDDVRIHVRFKAPQHTIYDNLQQFLDAKAVPDTITFNNGQPDATRNEFTISLYPCIWNASHTETCDCVGMDWSGAIWCQGLVRGGNLNYTKLFLIKKRSV